MRKAVFLFAALCLAACQDEEIVDRGGMTSQADFNLSMSERLSVDVSRKSAINPGDAELLRKSTHRTKASCGDVTTEGRCNGTTAEWCSDGELKSFDCSNVDMGCGYVNNDLGYYCTCDVSTYNAGCIGSFAVWCETPSSGGNPTLAMYNCSDNDLTCGISEGSLTCVESSGEGCGNVTYEGYCDGDVAYWCKYAGTASETIAHYDCSQEGKTCGLTSDGDYYCVEPSGGGCGSVTYEGYCDGNVLYWCDNPGTASETIARQDCSASDKVCGDDGDGNYYCKESSGGNCGNITSQGTCDGDVLTYCNDGELKTINCRSAYAVAGRQTEYTCDWSSNYNSYSCVIDDDTGASCGTVSSAGRCAGNNLEYCYQNTLHRLYCAEFGYVCGEDEVNGGYNCIESSSVTDGGTDGGSADSGLIDSGTDGGSADSGLIDSGTDGGSADSGVNQDSSIGEDSGSSDGGSVVTDGGTSDSGGGDPCNGVSYEGKCSEDGRSYSYCENGHLYTNPCPEGKICGFVQTSGMYTCVKAQTTDAGEPQDSGTVTDASGETTDSGSTTVDASDDASSSQGDASESNDSGNVNTQDAASSDASNGNNHGGNGGSNQGRLRDAGVDDSSTVSAAGCHSLPGHSSTPFWALIPLLAFLRRRR